MAFLPCRSPPSRGEARSPPAAGTAATPKSVENANGRARDDPRTPPPAAWRGSIGTDVRPRRAATGGPSRRASAPVPARTTRVRAGSVPAAPATVRTGSPTVAATNALVSASPHFGRQSAAKPVASQRRRAESRLRGRSERRSQPPHRATVRLRTPSFGDPVRLSRNRSRAACRPPTAPGIDRNCPEYVRAIARPGRSKRQGRNAGFDVSEATRSAKLLPRQLPTSDIVDGEQDRGSARWVACAAHFSTATLPGDGPMRRGRRGGLEAVARSRVAARLTVGCAGEAPLRAPDGCSARSASGTLREISSGDARASSTHSIPWTGKTIDSRRREDSSATVAGGVSAAGRRQGPRNRTDPDVPDALTERETGTEAKVQAQDCLIAVLGDQVRRGSLSMSRRGREGGRRCRRTREPPQDGALRRIARPGHGRLRTGRANRPFRECRAPPDRFRPPLEAMEEEMPF